MPKTIFPLMNDFPLRHVASKAQTIPIFPHLALYLDPFRLPYERRGYLNLESMKDKRPRKEWIDEHDRELQLILQALIS